MAAAEALFLLAQAAQPDLGAAVSREVARQECRQTDASEILVCGNRKRNERFRMPDRDAPFDPNGDRASVAYERGRWIEGGESGTESCSPVGQAGFTGCIAKGWDRARQQHAWGKNGSKKW